MTVEHLTMWMLALSICFFLLQGSQGFATASSSSSSTSRTSALSSPEDTSNNLSPFTHNDITWKIRPKEGTPMPEMVKWQAQVALKKLEYGDNPPLIVCPPGGQLLLEAHHQGKRIAKFGITSQSGPLAGPIVETIQDAFQETPAQDTGLAAIVYMVVEQDFRGRSLGQLALDIIGLIHYSVGCGYTVLVADDKSGEAQTLVKWYERHGFARAPKLQDFMGSPNGQYGITMIGPTKSEPPQGVTIEWW